MSMHLAHSGALSAPERLALAALMDSPVLDAARRQRRVELAARRKAIRTRPSAIPDLEQQIARATADVQAAAKACDEALEVLTAARKRHNAAYSALAGLEATRESGLNAKAAELGALADERCLPVDLWLQALRHLARGAVRSRAEPATRRVSILGTFGWGDHDITEMVEVSNLAQVEKAVSLLDTLRDQVRALVYEFDGPDVGPELKRIQTEALAAVQPLSAQGSLRLSDVPPLTVDD